MPWPAHACKCMGFCCICLRSSESWAEDRNMNGERDRERERGRELLSVLAPLMFSTVPLRSPLTSTPSASVIRSDSGSAPLPPARSRLCHTWLTQIRREMPTGPSREAQQPSAETSLAPLPPLCSPHPHPSRGNNRKKNVNRSSGFHWRCRCYQSCRASWVVLVINQRRVCSKWISALELTWAHVPVKRRSDRKHSKGPKLFQFHSSSF